MAGRQRRAPARLIVLFALFFALFAGALLFLFLLAAGDVYAPGETGGEAQHTLTKAEMPAHTHGYDFTGQSDVTGVTAIRLYDADGRRNEYQGASASAGGGAAHNNMPPYLAVYVWRRTA